MAKKSTKSIQPKKWYQKFFCSCKNIFTKIQINTTKLWGVISWVVAIILTVITVIGTFNPELDMTNMVTLCGLAYADVGVYIAVYASKAKAENKLKITYGFIDKLGDKYGVDVLTPILETILQSD